MEPANYCLHKPIQTSLPWTTCNVHSPEIWRQTQATTQHHQNLAQCNTTSLHQRWGLNQGATWTIPCPKTTKWSPLHTHQILATDSLYLFHFLAAPNQCSILLMMHAFLFHGKGRSGSLIALTLVVIVIVLLSTPPNSTQELYSLLY